MTDATEIADIRELTARIRELDAELHPPPGTRVMAAYADGVRAEIADNAVKLADAVERLLLANDTPYGGDIETVRLRVEGAKRIAQKSLPWDSSKPGGDLDAQRLHAALVMVFSALDGTIDDLLHRLPEHE